ncbi:3-methyladenine DNA glycosylase [Arachnomyces sp. PD_36]|nr:3-methyladenine DNA glycosylase [Arachnomyces sp. PD_36]
MAPRRSARVAASASAAAEKQAPPKPTPAQQAKEKRARVQKNGVSKATGSTTKKKKDTAKTTAAKAAAAAEFKVPDLPPPPSTPKRNTKTLPLLPVTPTPNLVSDLSSPATRWRDTNPPSSPPPMNRPVDPHTTNATLVTPRGSHLTTYTDSNNNNASSPSKTKTGGLDLGLPRPTTTTGNLLDEAVAHLIKMDERLRPVIEKFPCRLFSPEGLADEIDPFRSLVSGIIGQQVSGAAAKSIKNKFVALFNSKDNEGGKKEEEAWDRDERDQIRFPTPSEVVKCDIPTLRTAGLSQRKAEYILGLAEKFDSGELSAAMLMKATDEEVLEKLIAVRGLGKWSVEMFACFGLKRIDVFSTGDLGVQRGMAAFMGKDVSKLKAKGGGKFKYMSEKDMIEGAAKFAPYSQAA